MGKLWHFFSSWYVSGPLLAVLGVVIGLWVFFYVVPGKPKIGVIDIPFTVINDDSAFVISTFLEYARRDDSIKGVFIRLNSPGGGAAASEQLYFETRALRAEKPVVIIMNDIVASGGYMMSMGASYLYTKPSSFIGNVGVILSFPGPFISRTPSEQVVPTGPFKLNGGGRRYFIGITDQLKQAFATIVMSERGDVLKIPRSEVLSGRIWPGVEGVKLGIADEIGGDSDAIKKVASLAGISNYELVDVNTEVFRNFNQQFKRIIEPLEETDSTPSVAGAAGLIAALRSSQPASTPADDLLNPVDIGSLRRYIVSSGLGDSQDEVLPGFPLKVNGPQVYYLYVGPNQ
jgi:protease-4